MTGQPWITVVATVLIVVGAALLALWAVRTSVAEQRRQRSDGDDDPALLLQRRYARGDINAEEYARISADLLQDRLRA